ncbi:MAG: hypothetical protein WD604_14540 [Balneolaceae bacterium]
MAKPKKELPKDGLNIIRRLGKRGVSEVDIASALGMSYKTWKRIKDENPEAAQAIREARMKEESELVGVLYEAATTDKNLTAAMFLLKTRHGYKEGAEQLNANQVNVQITLPGAKSEAEYKKLVEVNNEPDA